MKGISCQCESTMYISDLWMNNEYIYIYIWMNNANIYIWMNNEFIYIYG